MFYELRVLGSNNHIKNIIPTKELSRRHWRNFENSEAQRFLPQVNEYHVEF
jgi:hypothetical protein